MNVQKIIKKRRLDLGLTLKDVAAALGVSEGTVSRYESADIQNMGIDKLVPLASVLHCSPGYLMGWDDYPESNTLSEPLHFRNIIFNLEKLNEDGLEKVLAYTNDLLGLTKYLADHN